MEDEQSSATGADPEESEILAEAAPDEDELPPART
jgi:hypothetical protein